MSIKYQTFPNTGFLEVILTDEELAPIRAEVEEIQQDFHSAVDHNHKLAGNLAKEYRLFKCVPYLNDLLFHYIKKYDTETVYAERISILTDDLPMIVESPWVNFQAKNEFNPAHRHTGIISFVIWLQVPFNIEDEMASSPCSKAKAPVAGNFAFHYTNSLGEICHHFIPVDHKMENHMLIFPAGLNHSVFPFYTSDEYRISISGNVRFKV
jgi:hypothetical protein